MSPISRWLFRYILVFIKIRFPSKEYSSSITEEGSDLKNKIQTENNDLSKYDIQ